MERKYYRLFVKRFPPYSGINKPYLKEEDVYAYSPQGARNTFLKYHSKGYGDYIIKGLREITKEEFCGHHNSGRTECGTIERAIHRAKEYKCWPAGPSSVTVEFRTRNGYTEDVDMDLHGPDTEAELKQLWESTCESLNADVDSVMFVLMTW